MLTGKHLLHSCAALTLAALSNSVFATPSQQIVVAPQCLIQAANLSPKVIANHKDFSLIEVNAADIEKLSDSKHQTKKPCGGFINVTSDWQKFQASPLAVKNNTSFLSTYSVMRSKSLRPEKTYSIRFEKEANQLIGQLNPTLMWDNLTTFSSNKDRYADSDNGVAAAKWIAAQIEAAATAAGRHDVSIQFVKTNGYKQPSVVAKLGNGNEAGVVIGAHMDTTDSYSGNKPGADDDGSGSMTVMESARTVITSGMQFKKPIYFVWYSAEEEGLLGSRAVVADFQKKKIPVEAVMHFDMTGFAYKNQPTIWIIDDYVDDGLTTFLEKIITTYTHRPVEYTRCGYACSDHASWTMGGYKAVIPAESRFEDTNPVMHSSRDTIDRLSITHMTDYAKIATAFAVELAEPSV